MAGDSRQNHEQASPDSQSLRSVCDSIEANFGELLESMPDGIIVADSSGRIVLINSQTEQLFGYGPGDLRSCMIEQLVPASLRDSNVTQRNAYIANPHRRAMGQGGKLLGHHRNGHQFPIEISLSPMQTDSGVLVCAAVRDVSERIRLEDAARANEELIRSRVIEGRYQDLSTDAPKLFASIDAATERIIDCSNALVLATGYTKDEPYAMPHISQLYHAKSEAARKKAFSSVTATGAVRDVELQLVHKDGRAIDVSLSLIALFGMRVAGLSAATQCGETSQASGVPRECCV